MGVDRHRVRQLLCDLFSVSELRVLVHDHFQDVRGDIAWGEPANVVAAAVVEAVASRGLLDQLRLIVLGLRPARASEIEAWWLPTPPPGDPPRDPLGEVDEEVGDLFRMLIANPGDTKTSRYVRTRATSLCEALERQMAESPSDVLASPRRDKLMEQLLILSGRAEELPPVMDALPRSVPWLRWLAFSFAFVGLAGLLWWLLFGGLVPLP